MHVNYKINGLHCDSSIYVCIYCALMVSHPPDFPLLSLPLSLLISSF
jgi:hypothetical protein